MKKLIITISIWLVSNLSLSAERIEINRGIFEPIPVAITEFASNDVKLGLQFADVITNDLESSGLFKILEDKLFIEKLKGIKTVPNFASWRQVGSNILIAGEVRRVDKTMLEVEFKLWDVFTHKQLAGKSYKGEVKNYRRIAHMISDEIYKRMTGEEGYFNTKIAYISESGAENRRIKRLAMMDYDGENHQFLTDGRFMVLTPRFSPNNKQIIYMSYANKTPRVYIKDLASGKEKLLGQFPGMTFAPRFSPKGDKVIMSMAKDGQTDIYEMDLLSLKKKRITTDNNINTSPSYSPDGKQIVFNSDRDGVPQLYVMNADGSNQHRISFGGGRYATPTWSPRGDLIAFTKWGVNKGEFYIGVMHPDGSGERLLTKGFLVEGPAWAPNGRVLLFTSQEKGNKHSAGRPRLHSIDLTGYNEREKITPVDASDPAWSHLLNK